MAFSEKNLARAELTTGIATYYTVPAATKTIVKQIHVCNTNAMNQNFTIHLVPNGGSADVSNAIASAVAVARNGMVTLNGWFIMETAGDTIRAKASSTGVSIRADGAEIT